MSHPTFIAHCPCHTWQMHSGCWPSGSSGWCSPHPFIAVRWQWSKNPPDNFSKHSGHALHRRDTVCPQLGIFLRHAVCLFSSSPPSSNSPWQLYVKIMLFSVTRFIMEFMGCPNILRMGGSFSEAAIVDDKSVQRPLPRRKMIHWKLVYSSSHQAFFDFL